MKIQRTTNQFLPRSGREIPKEKNFALSEDSYESRSYNPALPAVTIGVLGALASVAATAAAFDAGLDLGTYAIGAGALGASIAGAIWISQLPQPSV